MKPMPELDKLLARATKLGVFGTKMRSVIDMSSQKPALPLSPSSSSNPANRS